MKHIFGIVALAGTIALACACGNGKEVAYKTVDHYFLNARATEPELLVITSESELDSLCGMAAVMGKDGQPTPIDFDKEFAIAKALPETSKDTDLEPESLKVEKGKLVFSYSVKVGEERTYTIQPFAMVILSRDYLRYPVVENQISE